MSKHVSKGYLDTLWRKLIYAKWKGRCCRCKGTEGLQAAHIYPRRMLSTRWDLRNGLLMCSGPGTKNCHWWFDSLATVTERRVFVAATIGADTLEAIEAIATTLWDKDWERVREGLRPPSKD